MMHKKTTNKACFVRKSDIRVKTPKINFVGFEWVGTRNGARVPPGSRNQGGITKNILALTIRWIFFYIQKRPAPLIRRGSLFVQ
jgi:hypothetical protein